MSASCVVSATGTTTSVITTSTVTTTFSESVSTEPPQTTTITNTECVGSLSELICVSTTNTIVTTIPGVTTTIHVPVTSTVAVFDTETLTLFGTSCSSASKSDSQRSAAISISTPPPVVFPSSSATTLPNGQVSVIVQTITSTAEPSALSLSSPSPSPSSPPSSAPQTQDNTDGSSSVRLGPILGGVLSGFLGLLAIALIIWFILKRRRRWDGIFEPDLKQLPTKRFSLDAELESKPYHYGLVGQTKSPTVGISPPSSPPSLRPSNHLPQRNLTPLQLPSTASTPGLSATTMSSRPSTAGSMRPLHDAAPPPLPSSTPSPQPPPLKHNHTTSSGSSSGGSVHISPAMPMHWGHHSPSPSADQLHFNFDYPNYRSGSPTSMRELEPHQRLHLANGSRDDESISEVMVRSPTSPLPSSMLDGKGWTVSRPGLGLQSGASGVLVHTDAGPAPPNLLS